MPKLWNRIFIAAIIAFVAISVVAISVVAISVVGILCYGASIFVSALSMMSSVGLVAGDCPDGSSIGGANISGITRDANNQPFQNIYIRVWKYKGGCPQSQPFEAALRTDANGEFSTELYVHLGDPPVQIAILVPSYRLCVFEFDASRERFASLTLEITLQPDKLIIFGQQAFGAELNRLPYFKETITPCASA